MTKTAVARSVQHACKAISLGADVSKIVISASVGTGGSNRPNDVRAIQNGLNDVEIEDGGPDPLLAVDGIAGRLTCAAILKYQQSHVPVTDGRVDPGGPTLSALNGEGSDSRRAKSSGTQARRHRRLKLPPNTQLVEEIELLVPKVRRVIAKTQFIVASAEPLVTSKGVNPNGPFNETAKRGVHLLNASFSLSRFRDPLPAYRGIRRVFFNMNVALNRSFATDPLVAAVLFVSNTDVKEDDVNLAYTSAGGAFAKSDETFEDNVTLVNRIYLCNSLIQKEEITRIMTMVHELAHYVSGQPFTIDDFVNGDMRFSRPKFDRLKPEQKIRNADNYAFFALTCAFPDQFPE